MLISAKKYIVSFKKEQKQDVFDLIEKHGCFELEEKKQEKLDLEKTLQQKEYLVSLGDFAISFLNPFAEKVPFLKKLKGITLEKRETSIRKEDLERIVEIEKQTEILKKQKKDITQRAKDLLLFGNLDFIPKETEKTISFIVSVSESKREEFIKKDFYKRQLSNKYFLVISSNKDIQIDDKVEYSFPLPVKQQAEVFNKELKEIDNKEKGLEKEILTEVKRIDDYKIKRDLLETKRAKLEVQLKSKESDLLNYVILWAFDKDIKKLKHFNILEIKTTEEPPVQLENNKTMRPFEYVTEIFGLPRKGEIDPTPYLAPFFFLFFGICITDAGYGLVLAGLSLAGMFIFKGNKLIKLMFYGGIATFIVGVLFGSYFGFEALTVFKVIDPIKDTLLFMGIAFGLGYLQLMVAEVVKIISGKKHQNQDMLLSGVAWLLAFCFGIITLLSIKIPSIKGIGMMGLLVSGVSVLLIESKGTKIYLKPLVGLVKILQGLIGIMSDILSYSRLMALGLATAVIALIVNQIASLFSGMIPYVGWLVGGLILIGGHTFNLAINALSGFIHSGRLQFVEFFPKFLEGGGRRFNPLRSKLKYIK